MAWSHGGYQPTVQYGIREMSFLKIDQTGRVVLVTIDRPDALNALNEQLMHELLDALVMLDKSPEVGCFVITGSQRAFAAGADIAELASHDYSSMLANDVLSGWQAFADLRTPKIAAVAGYALGGGCELAMMCDLLFAGQNAKFGQPEIKLGLIPGMGGSQRLTRLIGRAKAMDMILTGRFIGADEALSSGLVSRLFPVDSLIEESLKVAEQIAGFGKTAAMVAKDAVNRAEETGLSEGALFERRTYHALWATADAKEGMQAFLEKREAVFNQSLI